MKYFVRLSYINYLILPKINLINFYFISLLQFLQRKFLILINNDNIPKK